MSDEKPVHSDNFWETERILIRAIEPGDWEVHYYWDLEAETQRNLDKLHFPKSKARTKHQTEIGSQNTPDGDDFHMEIELLETGDVIGVISSHHSDSHDGTFQYGVAIRKEFRRKGYAQEAIIVLMRYFFDELRYQKCHVNVMSWNEGSMRLHEKMGFVKEGQIRRAIYAMGGYHDKLIYGMTIEEFRERYD